MPVIVDTGGLIYGKLDAANASLTRLLGDATTASANATKILQAVGNLQAAATETSQTADNTLTLLKQIAAELAQVVEQLAKLYSVFFAIPATIGLDLTSAAARPQAIPTKPGP